VIEIVSAFIARHPKVSVAFSALVAAVVAALHAEFLTLIGA
jgi:hypothetical protein